MMLVLVAICTLSVAVFLAFRVENMLKAQMATTVFLETELKEIKAAQLIPASQLPYGWFDDGWPFKETDEERKTPLENPTPHHWSDDYATKIWIAQFQSFNDPHARKEYLRGLFKQGVWMKPELLDVIYADNNAFVRAWAAAHLYTVFTDYSDWEHPREIRNYEPQLLQDPDPVVRAALWSNPHCKQLPWWLYRISEAWKEQIQTLSQIERLGLMRNPELPNNYVVALLSTTTDQLNLSRDEHCAIVKAAAVNPHVINTSRFGGRKAPDPAFEPFGKMWELCLAHWMDTTIPYLFFKYIQTTPEVKLATYNRLLQQIDDKDKSKYLREAVIDSCNDVFLDKEVLRAASNDPDGKCREIATKRVGKLAKIVGVV